MTPLDTLCLLPFHEAPTEARAAILRRLADTTLFAAMEGVAAGDAGRLMRLEAPGGAVALACDREDRLADFFGRPVDYAAMPGRVLAAMLAEEGVGLLVNPGAPSEMLLDGAMLGWLVTALAARPDADEAAARLTPPDPAMVAALMPALGERLADMAGMARAATLARADFADGRAGHLLLIEGARTEDEAALAKAVAELVAFLPPLPAPLDVSFAPLPAPEGAPRITLEPIPATPKPKRENAPPRLR